MSEDVRFWLFLLFFLYNVYQLFKNPFGQSTESVRTIAPVYESSKEDIDRRKRLMKALKKK